MNRVADWYIDYVSPYPYLQMARFGDLPPDLEIRPRPVLFAGLLNHWGHKGPAEIPEKARQTYLYTRWLAEKRGLAFAGPPRHPFNPLALLRLTLVAGGSVDVVRRVYEHVWGAGRDGQAADSVAALAAALGVDDHEAALAAPEVKAAVRANTDEAISRGVYGVPTFAVGGRLFWGDDATDMMVDFLADPAMFERPEYARVEEIPAAARRIDKEF